MLITVKARAHYLHEQCKNRFTRIIGGFALSNALLAHLFLVDFYLKVSCFHGAEEPDIKHAIFHFHTWIWSSDPWLAEGALSVSEVTNLGITGRESTWRVLPLPISSWLSPLFFYHILWFPYVCLFSMGNSRSNALCTAGRQLLLIQTHRCLLCTGSIASARKETIWIPPSWSVYSPCKHSLWTQYPNRESYFLQWPSISPFHQGATPTKAQSCKRSFPSWWYLAVTAENRRCGNGLWEGTFTKSILSPWPFSCLVILHE